MESHFGEEVRRIGRVNKGIGLISVSLVGLLLIEWLLMVVVVGE